MPSRRIDVFFYGLLDAEFLLRKGVRPLVEPPAESERNPEYAAKLGELAERLQLPRDYIGEISALASGHGSE